MQYVSSLYSPLDRMRACHVVCILSFPEQTESHLLWGFAFFSARTAAQGLMNTGQMFFY